MKFIKTFLFFIFLVSFVNFVDAASITGSVAVDVISIPVWVTSSYSVYPHTSTYDNKVNFYWSISSDDVEFTQCQLLGNNSNVLTNYGDPISKNVGYSWIIYDAPSAVGSYGFYIRCRSVDYPSAISISSKITVDVVAPDLKVTAWDNCLNADGTYNSSCNMRAFVWGGYNHVDGTVELPQAGFYQLSWDTVPLATSCTLGGLATTTSATTKNTYVANPLSSTYTLLCTNNTSGQIASDSVTIKRPPMPTNLTTSCSADGKTATINWATVSGYTDFYTRASQYGVQILDAVVTAQTDSFTVDPNVDYGAWIHTRASNGAWSNSVSKDGNCALKNNLTITSPGRISGTYSSPGTYSVNYGSSPVVTAEGWAGYSVAITGGCTASAGVGTSASCTVSNMTSAKTVTVTYTQNTNTLTIISSGNISGTYSHPGTYSVNYGSSPVVTAEGWAGYSVAITGGCTASAGVGTSASCTVSNMTSAKTVTVTYTITSYVVTASVSGSGGTISPASATVNYGSTKLFTITPNAGRGISTVTGCGGTLSGSTFTTGPITSACTVTVTFVFVNCTSGPTGYTKCADEGGTCSFADNANVAYGCNSSFYYESSNTSIGCSNSDFGGDPLSGIKKACFYKPLTGNLRSDILSCTIPINGIVCTTNPLLTWSTTNPIGTSAVTASATSVGATSFLAVNVSGNSGSQRASFTVPYPSRTFYLYNNSLELNKVKVDANCAATSHWDSTLSKCIVSVNGGWSTWTAKSTACGFTGDITRTCNTPAPLNGGTQCMLTDGTTGLTETQSYTTDPCAPLISGPTSTYVDARESFGFLTTNPNGHAIEYGVDWDNNGTVDNWLPYDWSYVPSGVSQSITKSSPTSGIYTFKALAQDKMTGRNSVWSSHTVAVALPVNGGWTPWTTESTSCGVTDVKTRSCTNPAPANGGSQCTLSDNVTKGITEFSPYTTAPCAPAFSTPTSSYVNYNLNFTINSTNPNNHNVRYGVDWNNDTNADLWIPATGYVPSGVIQYFNHSWSSVGSYTVKALTQDEDGKNSSWTTPSTITIKVVPAAPVITGTATPSTIEWGKKSLISYHATNDATSCSPVNDFFPGTDSFDSNTGDGNFTTAKLNKRTTIKISCTGPGGVATGSVNVSVKDLRANFSEQ